MNKQKKTKKNWIDDNKYITVLSISVAALIWIVVAMTAGRGGYVQEFTSIPVDITLQADAFIKLGLNPIEASIGQVTARVEGDRVAITSQDSSYFLATVEIPDDLDIDGPGNYSLPLVPAHSDYDRSLYTDIEYEPQTIQVKFDRLATATFDVKEIINGMSVAAGFIRGAQTITPSQVTIRGPQSEIEKIDRCVITAELMNPLEKNHVVDYPIKALDAKGDVINLENSHLSIDYTQARLVIEVMRNMSLDLKIGFTNIPRGFPVDELDYRLTTNTIQVGVPLDQVGKVGELLVGLIDIRTINKDSFLYTYPLELPENYLNVDEVKAVNVRFPTAGWEEAYFTAKGIELLNVPDQYDIRVLGGDTIYNVKFVGKPEVLTQMTSDDIVMEIDFSDREIVVGQSQIPVKISAPTMGLVWATDGSYNVVIQVTEKEQLMDQ